MTKEELEKGIAISRRGKVRLCELFDDVQEGESHIIFSPDITRSNFKPGKFVEVSKNGVSIRKTMRQTTQEAACVVLYMGMLINKE